MLDNDGSRVPRWAFRADRHAHDRTWHAAYVAVAGVDVCAGRWVAVVLDDKGHYVGAESKPGIADLVEAVESLACEQVAGLDVVAVDIPIGLPEAGRRAADLAVRHVLGIRRSSLFVTPTRAALQERDFDVANVVNRESTSGAGVSKQAHALRDRVLEVDDWLATNPPIRVIEVHPELSFRHLTGAPMQHRKKTWAGMNDRRAALTAAGIHLPGDLGAAGVYAGVDDVLDAAVAAWSALRVLHGNGERYPANESVDNSQVSVIWA